MIYVAAPYSSPLVGVQDQRLDRTFEFVLHLVKHGVTAFSPVVYFRPTALALNLLEDAATWHKHNMAFLRRADAVFVLRLTGWEQSKGVQIELKLARALHIPVEHFSETFDPVS